MTSNRPSSLANLLEASPVPGSMGRPLHGIRIAILDNDYNVLPPNTPGLLAFKCMCSSRTLPFTSSSIHLSVPLHLSCSSFVSSRLHLINIAYGGCIYWNNLEKQSFYVHNGWSILHSFPSPPFPSAPPLPHLSPLSLPPSPFDTLAIYPA